MSIAVSMIGSRPINQGVKMKWPTLAGELLGLVVRRIAPLALAAVIALLVDVGLLDAHIGRSVDHLLRPSGLSLIQADTALPRWATRW